MVLSYDKSSSLALFGLSCLFSATSVVEGCPTILLASGDRINQGEVVADPKARLLLTQQFGGNLQVYTGEPGNLKCLVWESGFSELPSDSGTYNTRFFDDGVLVTSKLNEQNQITFPWTSGIAGADKSFYVFAVTCDGEVGIYEAKDLTVDTTTIDPIWSEQGNDCGLTTCERTVLMSANDQVSSNRDALQKSEGAFILQQENGNVMIVAGTTKEPGEILWQSCSKDNPLTEYFTTLQADSNFITRALDNQIGNVWKRDDFVEEDKSVLWQLALECNKNTNEYNRLVISDPKSTNVVWTSDLRPTCETGAPVCSSATVLLDMDERIQDGVAYRKTVTFQDDEYVFGQRRNGDLELFKTDNRCVAWESTPVTNQLAVKSYTVMQNDGNLVTYRTDVVGGASIPIWATGTEDESSDTGSFTFVIEDCSAALPAVAIYENNPTTDDDARMVWWAALDKDCFPVVPKPAN